MDGRRATRNAAVSVAQTVLSAVLLFGLYRYLLEVVGPEGIGIWSVILASTGAARIAELGLGGSAVKYVAQYLARGDAQTAAEVAETTVVTLAVAMGAMALLAYPAIGALLPYVIEPSGLDAARELLPWACASFWLTSVAAASQGALDGCSRYDVRNAILFGSHVLFVGLAVALVGPMGLVGLAVAQIAQGVAWIVAEWVAIRRFLPGVSRVPHRWRWGVLREMLSYGASFQGLAILRLLFEPTTKALLSRYGGLSVAGFYEMASQAVLKFRSLVVAAQQVLTSEVATLHEAEPERVNPIYAQVNRLNWALTLLLFGGVAAGAPLLSLVWIGAYEPVFVLFMALLAAGWCANTLSVPAYFFLLGTGQLRGVLASHVTIAVVNAALGVALGIAFGGEGVAVAWAVALAAGTLHQWVWLRRNRGVGSGPPRSALGLTVAVGLGLGGAFALSLRDPSSLGLALAGAGIYSVLAAVALWQMPERTRVVEAVRGFVARTGA